jgi:TolB-like protein/Tfp pilus assembly protein PilF
LTESSKALFLSYASEDAEAAARICATLRGAGIEVWFDQSELRGGDAWDRQIRKQIHECSLFVPIISAHSQNRLEGYFRREWKLAADRTSDMAEEKAFLVPVVIDDTSERYASVPDKFREVQWTHLLAGETTPAFVERLSRLLSPDHHHESAQSHPSPGGTDSNPSKSRVREPFAGSFWRSRPPLLLIVAAIVIVLGYLAVEKFWMSKRIAAGNQTTDSTGPAVNVSQSIIPEKSIAVLPFVDMSEKKDQEYFADGMAEEILDILAEIPQLTVIGRTSSFQFRNRAEDLRAIGEMLAAAFVVEGTVRKAGARIRVTAQLIDSKSGAHIWSESYDREFGDVLTLQDEIALAIARALQVTIVARDSRPLQGEHSTEAYTLYLKGRVALDSFNTSSLADAQSAFQQALALDATLLPAAEGLALTMVQRATDANDLTPIEGWEQAKLAAYKALEIDPNSATAHSVLGFVAAMRDFDWTTAETEFHKALGLSPNNSDTLKNMAEVSTTRGNRVEALRLINALLVLDPLNANTFQLLGIVLYLNSDYSGAESVLRKSLAINPNIDANHFFLGLIQLKGGHLEAAMQEFLADEESSNRAAGLALAYHALGRKSESDAALARLIQENSLFWPSGIALVYAYRGERNEAFTWLEKAYAARDSYLLTFLLGDPFLTPLHDDPRWTALLRKMNLLE